MTNPVISRHPRGPALALLASLCVSLALPLPTLAAARTAMHTTKATEAPHAKAVLSVTVALGEGDDEILGKRLKNEATAALARQDVDVVRDNAPSQVSVEVRWNADDNHEITVRVTNRGEPSQAVQGSPFVCDGCGENELIAKIKEVVPQCVPLLPEVEATPADNGKPVEHPDDFGNPTEPGRKPLRALGKAGIALMVVGAGATVGGVVMVAMGRESADNAADPSTDDTTDHRPPGLAVVSVGATVLLAGAGMLIADRLLAKRRAVTVAPSLTPRFAGLSVSARF